VSDVTSSPETLRISIVADFVRDLFLILGPPCALPDIVRPSTGHSWCTSFTMVRRIRGRVIQLFALVLGLLLIAAISPQEFL
jgi:hypothetical protein